MDNNALSLVDAWIPRCYFGKLRFSFILQTFHCRPAFRIRFCKAGAVRLFSCSKFQHGSTYQLWIYEYGCTMLYQGTSVHLVGFVAWFWDFAPGFNNGGCCPGQRNSHGAATSSISRERAASRDSRELLWGQQASDRQTFVWHVSLMFIVEHCFASVVLAL